MFVKGFAGITEFEFGKAVHNLDVIVGGHLNLTVFWSSEVDSLMLKKLPNIAKTFDMQKETVYIVWAVSCIWM